MSRRHLWPVWALVVWTLLVWATRIGTIWSDAELDTAGKVGRSLLVASFVVLAAVTVAALWRWASALVWAVRAFAAWTIAVWAVRLVAIATGGHEAAFVIVHAVLAAVSVVLALGAWRATLPVRHGPARHRHRGAVDPA